ncbi:hypothetical protein [Actinomadura violacea]|uniref:Uncharacterized protein n=1 Tax=Actinomadura violacea TaxID=2819934 RepID=A0ABS3RWI1_9ACTN|nr:hypothetical protein [Actinomadura violacea]MBO2461119.1 hypothetical protein [Actinomadura violacea]
MAVWIALPDLPERVRFPMLAWASITATVLLLKAIERPPQPAEPAYQAGFVDGYDAAATTGRKAQQS